MNRHQVSSKLLSSIVFLDLQSQTDAICDSKLLQWCFILHIYSETVFVRFWREKSYVEKTNRA